jgi:sugar lactone lactonase YvrE
MASDRQGNVWTASCGNDTVTVYRQGDPSQAMNIPLGPTPPSGDPQIKPFGAVIDLQGNLWVTGNRSDAMYVLSPSGALIATLPSTYQGNKVITKPIGNAVDSKGNVWVANSDWLDAPCPTRTEVDPLVRTDFPVS